MDFKVFLSDDTLSDLERDGHIKDIDQTMLRIELKASDVDCPVIASPWKIVNNFF